MNRHTPVVVVGSIPAEKDEFCRWTAEAFVKGKAVYGELGLDCVTYAARIEMIARKYLPMRSITGISNLLRQLNGIDLYLATACAVGSEPAWNTFKEVYRQQLVDLCRFMCSSEETLWETFESTWSHLFLPDRSGNSRIASYDGRSSLATWLRVLVSNRMLNERRQWRKTARRLDEIPDLMDDMALLSVEARVRRGRYESVARECLQEVCKRLTSRERLLLLARYEEGLRLSEIACLLHVHLSSVARRIERLLRRLRNETEALLASQHQMSPAAIEECFRTLVQVKSHSIPIVNFIKEGGVCSRTSQTTSPDAGTSRLAS